MKVLCFSTETLLKLSLEIANLESILGGCLILIDRTVTQNLFELYILIILQLSLICDTQYSFYVEIPKL